MGALLIFFTTGLQLMTRKDVPLKDSKSYRFTLFSALACCLSEMPDFRLAPGTLGIGERLQEMGGGRKVVWGVEWVKGGASEPAGG